MSYTITFDNAAGWDLPDGFVHDPFTGYPDLGCLKTVGQLNPTAAYGGGFSVPITLFDLTTYYVRYVSTSPVEVALLITEYGTAGYSEIGDWRAVNGDTGWLPLSGMQSAIETLSALTIQFAVTSGYPGDVTMYIDTITLNVPPVSYGLAHSSGGMPGAVMIP